MKYRTIEGEVLDEIYARYYGVGVFDIRKVYAANFGFGRLWRGVACWPCDRASRSAHQ